MRRRPRARLAAVVATLVVAAACSGGSDRVDPDFTIPDAADLRRTTTTTAPAGDGASPFASAAGRLAVIDADGDLVVFGLDGSNPVVASPASSAPAQPTFSPDGTRLAWSDTAVPQLVVTEVGDVEPGTARTSITVPIDFPAFYLSWDPTGSRLAVMGGTDQGQVIGVVELDDDPELDVVGRGSPYFLSWLDDGTGFIGHLNDAIALVDAVSGTTTPLAEATPLFQAPVWGNGRIVHAAPVAGEELEVSSVVLTEVGDPSTVTEVARYEGFGWFVASPDRRRIALLNTGPQEVAPPTSDDAAGITARQAGVGAVRAQATGPVLGQGVHIIDLDAATVVTISTDLRLGAQWSPDGTRLLTLLPETDPDTDELWFRWSVWSADGALVGNRFLPSDRLRGEYLPFHDQYAQSLSWWSPDSRAFVYAGANVNGDEAVWIADASDPSVVTRVTAGTVAVWGP